MNAVQLDPKDNGPAQLTLTGTITDEGGTFGLGFAIRREAKAMPVEDNTVKWIAVDLLGADGVILMTTLVPAMPVCAIPGPDGKAMEQTIFLVDSLIALVDDVRAMVVRDEERVFLERVFSAEPPVVDGVQVTSQKGGSYTVTWSAYHPDGNDLEHIVVVSQDDGATWRPTTLPLQETSVDVSVAPASGIKMLLFAVVTTDGLNTVSVAAGPIEATLLPPQLAVLAPGPGTVQSPVKVVACTTDLGQLSDARVTWISPTDGEVAQGMSALARFTPGKHELTAVLIDDAGQSIASDSVEIYVE